MADFPKERSNGPEVVTDKVRVSGMKVKRKKDGYWRKGYTMHTKDGKTIHVPRKYIKFKEKEYSKKPYDYKRKEIKFGGGFDELAERVSIEYQKKVNPKTGKKYTVQEANAIGKDVAADVYREKEYRAVHR